MEYVWVGLIVAAVALDWLLVQWMRRQGRRPDSATAVYVFGVYSPFLSWLKSFLRPRPKPGPPSTAEIVRLMAAYDPAPGAPRPANSFDAEPPTRGPSGRLSRVRPWAVWVAGGLGLAALSWMAVQPAPFNLTLLGLLGLALAGLGVAGSLWPRLAFAERGLEAVARWLGVGPAQVVGLSLSPAFALLAGLLSWSDPAHSLNPWVANTGWLAAMALALTGGWQGGGQGSAIRWRALAVAGALAAAALVVRGYDLTGIPVTLTGDEGSSGISAAQFSESTANNLFGIGWHGFASLYFFIQSLPLAVFGRTIAAVRLSSVVAGALTVGAVYLAGRAMFGRRTGLLAALLLGGLHFHLHFSRIGLNNIWDGLSAVVVLGLAWHAWTTQRRMFFLLAGLALGLAQFFYPSARVLAAVLLAWFAVMGWRDRPRLRRLLPDLGLMALATAVTVLPLAMFYWRHPDEYFGPLKAVSLFGPVLDSMVRDRGLPAWRIVLEQIGLGLGAFALTPIKFWYRPDVPILRLLPAFFFWVGLAALALRPRQGRGLMLALWLAGFALVGGLSESTPAAQRYVGSAAACALVAAYGVTTAGAWLAWLWPRVARGVPALVLLTGLFLAVDDARFYYLEYTPQSRMGGRYDFEGLGGAMAGRLAAYLKDVPAEWQVIHFGWPRVGFYSIPSLQFLAPHISGLDMVAPYGSPDNPIPTSDRLIFVFLDDHGADLQAVLADRPGGWLLPVVDGAGQLILTLYQVPAPENTAALAATVPPTPAPDAPDVSPGLVLGVYALLVLAWAVWQLWRPGAARQRATRFPALAQSVPSAVERFFAPAPTNAEATVTPSTRVYAASASNPASAVVNPAADPAPAEPSVPAIEQIPAASSELPPTFQSLDAPPPAEPPPSPPAPTNEPDLRPVAEPAPYSPSAPEPPAPPPSLAPASTAPPAQPGPARMPRVAQVQVTLTVPPGARLRLQIDDISPDLPQPLPLLAQELYAPTGQVEVPATVAVSFGPVAPLQPALPEPAPEAALIAPTPAPPPPPMAAPAQSPVRSSSPAPVPSPVAAPAAAPEASALPPRAAPAPQWLPRARAALAALAARAQALPAAGRLDVALFASALVLYAATRLIGIEQYPIYFFTDEAAHTVLAADFVNSGLRNYEHEFLPTYFSLGPTFNLNSVSVYVQVIPYLLFGFSEAVTRGVSALITLIAAAAVGFTLRDVFRMRYWWTATLLLAIAPAWFLHSRTAFEYIELASFYAGFLYAYLRYRTGHPASLYAAVVFGALAYYTHGLGAILMGLTALFFFLADLRYHWEQRAVVGRALALALVLALPFLRYSLAHPSSYTDTLRQRGSFWLDQDLSFAEKAVTYAREYAYGLSPSFWFLPNDRDIERHVMNGYGNLWLPTLPFAALGLLLAVRRVRTPAYRLLLLALLATPAGSALVAIGVPRMLWFIVPATLLTGLGLAAALDWVAARWLSARAVALAAFAVLSAASVYLLSDALRNGALWSNDYTLAGTQWGGRQLFDDVIPELLEADPDLQVYVSPTWANGTELIARFFMPPELMPRFQLQGPDYYLDKRRDLPPNLLVVLQAREYEQMRADPKIGRLDVERELPYPDGSPGFFFVRLGYSAEADALFALEQAASQIPVTEEFLLDGQLVSVTHPRFGAGLLPDMLDGDRFTLINAPEINPVVLDFVFPAPRSVAGITLITGSLQDVTVTLDVYTDPAGAPVTVSETFRGLPPDPTMTLVLNGQPLPALRVRVTVQDNLGGAGVNIHIRELDFTP